MIIVTGGAGFIGANLVKALNEAGEHDIMVVDNLCNTQKIRNLSDLKIADYMDKQDFLQALEKGHKFKDLDTIFHQGACSDTMHTDGRYVLQNNYTYSKSVLNYCIDQGVRLIYASSASVYGSGEVFIEQPKYESALNAYAWSKLMFDNYVRNQATLPVQCAGLRYFNVYGPRESHKNRMASVAWHFYNQYLEDNTVRLFEGSSGYTDGEQVRDFVYVDDVVDINLYLWANPQISGIFNAGSGQCHSFNQVALAVINHFRRAKDQSPCSLEQARAENEISYIAMPETLIGKYQSYTRANLDALRATGYRREFADITTGIDKYLSWLASTVN